AFSSNSGGRFNLFIIADPLFQILVPFLATFLIVPGDAIFLMFKSVPILWPSPFPLHSAHF
ncbi:MAG: hypothetical protein RR466_06620, partial [Hungatella sp.]